MIFKGGLDAVFFFAAISRGGQPALQSGAFVSIGVGKLFSATASARFVMESVGLLLMHIGVMSAS